MGETGRVCEAPARGSRAGAAGVTVACGGEIDLATAPPFLAALALALSLRPAHLGLDLSAVTFVDVRTVGAVATAAIRMGDWDGTLRVDDAAPPVRRAFALCGCGPLLAAEPRPAEAALAPGCAA